MRCELCRGTCILIFFTRFLPGDIVGVNVSVGQLSLTPRRVAASAVAPFTYRSTQPCPSSPEFQT